MTNYDFYDVYDNRTDCIVACGTYTEIEDYFECEGRYCVVCRTNNPVLTEKIKKTY